MHTKSITHFHAGIIYRDLKPENLLLDPVGHIKLTDFGLAREECDKEGLFTVAGSAYYMAPEIVLMKGHDYQADWWSLGVLIYEMLTGLPPFYSSDAKAGYQKLLTQPIEFPDHVSRDARKLITGLLATDPAKRLGVLLSNKGTSEQANGKPDGASKKLARVKDGQCIKLEPWFAKIDFAKVLQKQVRMALLGDCE
jgi:serine/threonine protein kinase